MIGNSVEIYNGVKSIGNSVYRFQMLVNEGYFITQDVYLPEDDLIVYLRFVNQQADKVVVKPAYASYDSEKKALVLKFVDSEEVWICYTETQYVDQFENNRP